MLIIQTDITFGIVKRNRITHSKFKRCLATSFGEGVGSLLVLKGGLRFRRIPSTRDVKTLSSDWYRVGNTMRYVEKKLK